MNTLLSSSFTSFEGHRRIATGTLQENALVVKRAIEGKATDTVLIFDDRTGRSIDVDMTGTEADVKARLAAVEGFNSSPSEPTSDQPKGPGRPKLGVVSREVTLLPRHWEWLETQPGGASVTLRKLVEAARRTNSPQEEHRLAQERAYHFMSAMAGDMSGFEEAARALFANDPSRFGEHIASWPQDVREYAAQLAAQ
jgi:hypothetical protein